jgi:hypothetical protein
MRLVRAVSCPLVLRTWTEVPSSLVVVVPSSLLMVMGPEEEETARAEEDEEEAVAALAGAGRAGAELDPPPVGAGGLSHERP